MEHVVLGGFTLCTHALRKHSFHNNIALIVLYMLSVLMSILIRFLMNRLYFTVQRYDKVSGIQNKNGYFSQLRRICNSAEQRALRAEPTVTHCEAERKIADMAELQIGALGEAK